jgi:hypothetical protein
MRKNVFLNEAAYENLKKIADSNYRTVSAELNYQYNNMEFDINKLKLKLKSDFFKVGKSYLYAGVTFYFVGNFNVDMGVFKKTEEGQEFYLRYSEFYLFDDQSKKVIQ